MRSWLPCHPVLPSPRHLELTDDIASGSSKHSHLFDATALAVSQHHRLIDEREYTTLFTASRLSYKNKGQSSQLNFQDSKTPPFSQDFLDLEIFSNSDIYPCRHYAPSPSPFERHMPVPIITLTVAFCVIVVIPLIPSAIHRNAAALLSVVTTVARLLHPWRPCELMKSLDDVLENIQQRLDECKEDQGGSINIHLVINADMSFTQYVYMLYQFIPYLYMFIDNSPEWM